MENFKNQRLRIPKIQITFEQVKVNAGELNNRIDSIFDILFEETLKTSLNQSKGDISVNHAEMVGKEVNKQICLS